MNSWDARLTKTFKVRNTCEKCFCKIYDIDQDAFRSKMEDFWTFVRVRGSDYGI